MLEQTEKKAILTTSEQEIALLAAGGLSNKAIASELNSSEGTVKVHMHNIFKGEHKNAMGSNLREKISEAGVHRDVVLTRRAMDSLGIDYMVVFPTPMLFLGMHPQPEMEVWLGRAYNRWMVDRVLSADDRIKTLVYLPFNTPDEAVRTVEEFGDKKGVIGFCVTSTRYKPIHHNDYMRLYATIQDFEKPLAFHSGYHWQDQSLAT